MKLCIFAVIVVLFAFPHTASAAFDIVVAADGSGDVRTIGEAVERVPENNTKRFVIEIKPGTYAEQVRVPQNKPLVSFIGESAETTKITFGLSSAAAGSTSASFSVYIGGSDFYAENITFENSFGRGAQAVAVLVDADRAVFSKCRFLGWQDTLYAKNGRQYYKDCYIEGSVDYIFGQAAAVFENCEIHSKGDGFIAAPMRFTADEPAGLIFQNCRITSENTKSGIYLGRPWRDYGRAVFINTRIDAAVRPEGWNNWQPGREKTAYFAEYNSTGNGAGGAARVKWSRTLTEAEVRNFSAENFLSGSDRWNPKTAADERLEKTKPTWKPVTWSEALKQKPPWYQTDEAARIADQLLIYQKDNGGFEKNIDMAAMLTQKESQEIAARKADVSATTIDNRTTYTQVAYLGKIVAASRLKSSPPANLPKYLGAFNKGLDYLLAAQYENGGYPQYYPLKKGYYTRITFNDDAMIGVLEVLRRVAAGEGDFRFVDGVRRARAERAVARAVPLILRLQVEIGGRKTIWAAQYDEVTLKPAAARKFEPISLSAGESTAIVRFLMGQKLTPEIGAAVEAAVAWYKKNQIEGVRWVRVNGENSVVADKSAPPVWARFYEIETMKPIFVGRDAVVKYNVMQIEPERRNGYAWYVTEPNELLTEDYPEWKRRTASEVSNKP